MLKPFLITFFAIVGGVFALNRSLDLGGAFNGPTVERLAASQAAADILVSETDIDQRRWVRARLAAACPKVLILGSSTVGGFTPEMFGEGDTLNAWLTGPTAEDYEAVTYLLQSRGCRPQRIIVGTDPWYFNSAFTSDRWTSLASEYSAYKHAGTFTTAGTVLRTSWAGFKEELNFITTLKSLVWVGERSAAKRSPWPFLKLFQGSLFQACAASNVELVARFSDGHFESCPQSLLPADRVAEIARNYVASDSHSVTRWKALDPARLKSLTTLLAVWRAQTPEVILLAPPYHPEAYAALRANPLVSRLLDELDTTLQSAAQAAGARYFNLRDPARAGCNAGEFMDGHHAGPRCLAREAAALRSRSPDVDRPTSIE